MKFNTVKLGEYLYIKGRIGWKGLKKKEYLDKSDFRIINGESLTENGIDWNKAGYISKERYDESPEIMLQPDDILISKDGTIGKIGYVDSLETPTTVASGIFVIRNQKPEIINTRFIYHFFCSKYFKNFIAMRTEGSVIPHLYQKDFVDLDFPLPQLSVQDKIVGILDAICNKIDLNKSINENLEQQAQAYFQELFVDNADPEWTTGTISDLGTVVGGSTPSKAKPEYYTETGIAWITPKDLSINKSKFVSHGENDITELGLKNSSAVIMPEGTVLFSSRAPIGYIAIAAGEVTTNQGFKSVVPKSEVGTPFVYFFLKNTLPVIEGMASGSTFKEVSGSTMKNVPAVIPDAETLAKFSDFCAPIFAQQHILEGQNQSLATLRDNLLPKLMSGEIDVSAVHL